MIHRRGTKHFLIKDACRQQAVGLLLLPLLVAGAGLAQDAPVPAPETTVAAPAPAAAVPETPAAAAPAPDAATPDASTPAARAPSSSMPPVSAQHSAQAAGLISEALSVANANPEARVVTVHSAAALLPRLAGNARSNLTDRWARLAMNGVPRPARLEAMSAFFDVAARADPTFGQRVAASVPDASARTGGFIALSQRVEATNWTRADLYATKAQRAARQEQNPYLRARDLTFVASRLATLDPAIREAAVTEASSHVHLLGNSNQRDYLLAEVVGAASKFDLTLAHRIAGSIQHPGLRRLADARINISLASQTSLTKSSADAVSALAKAAAPYDIRAVPILLQLPPEPDVLKAIGNALPHLSPTMPPAVDESLLEHIWDYSKTAPAGVYRDQLQSRLARQMVLHNLWRGRAWGMQLPWKGGRIAVGAFLKRVAAARQSQLNTLPLLNLAQHNVNQAIVSARQLPPAPRAEALLLIAGQLLG